MTTLLVCLLDSFYFEIYPSINPMKYMTQTIEISKDCRQSSLTCSNRYDLSCLHWNNPQIFIIIYVVAQLGVYW